jgi:GlcNAc-P-P-Und epimerase
VSQKPGRTLVTGGSGFLGRHVVDALVERGEDVTVLALDTLPGRPTIVADLGSGPVDLPGEPFRRVYHLAGLAHVEPHSEEERQRFFAVNLGGTRSLLESLERSAGLPESLLLVSTVAVYGIEAGSLLDESTERLARDPYGLSKLQAEDAVVEWGARHGVRTSIVRLPLIAGPRAPGNLGKMVRALRSRRYVGVGKGSARRSLVRVADVVATLPRVADEGGVFHLTDGHHPSFAELETALARALGRGQPLHVPLPLARLLAACGNAVEAVSGGRAHFNMRALSKMTSSLTFSDQRARQALGWAPKRVVDCVEELL